MTILIAGAGPTGLTAALVLAANGVPFRIIDKRVAPSDSSRALGLQARSMEVLAGLGIAERVERVAYPLQGATIMRGDRPLVTMAWVPPESRYPYTYVVPQSGLEEILRERLDDFGVEIERGIEVAAVSSTATGVTVELADGRNVEADWLIGADGARSRVREAVGIAFPYRKTGETYHLADATLDLRVDLGDSGMWLGPRGPLMLMRLPDDPRSWRVFVDMTDAAKDGDLPPLSAGSLERLLADRGPQGSRVASLHWTSVFETRLGLADAYRRGRAFIAGDAAHVFPPFGGQGMNLGIQDAVNLSWRLAAVERGASADLLEEYERERRPIAAATIADVEARRRLYALRNPLARSARDLLLKLGGRSRRASRQASLQNSQLATTYRRVTPGGERGPDPRPGDRAPDGPFLEGTLHELFAPDHATLLVFDARRDGASIDREPTLHTVFVTPASDPAGRLRRAYGVRGQWEYVLVRPDGHIASRGTDRNECRARARALIGLRTDA